MTSADVSKTLSKIKGTASGWRRLRFKERRIADGYRADAQREDHDSALGEDLGR